MKKLALLFILAFSGFSCDRLPDPDYETLENYSFGFQLQQGQKFDAGSWVGDSIPFWAYNIQSGEPESIKVEFEVVRGGGNVTVSSGNINSGGYINTHWQLGSSSFEQKLMVRTYDQYGHYLTSTYLTEYAFRPNAWDTCSLQPDGSISGMIADTLNGITLMVTNSQLYRQGEKYYDWVPVNDPVLVSPRTINMDSNRVIYVSTWYGELLKSTDHGFSWEKCTRPFPDRPYYFYIYVSNDNYVWAFAWDHLTRYSSDGGITWTDISPESGLTAVGFGDIFRLKDGSILYHGGNCCELNRSFDDGKTWTKIMTPEYSQKLYVTETDEIFIVSEGVGSIIYKSDDYGATFTKVIALYPEWRTTYENTFINRGSFYYVFLPGLGIYKCADLNNPSSYTEYYHNTNLVNLFIDHKGDIMAKGNNNYTIYYHTSDPQSKTLH